MWYKNYLLPFILLMSFSRVFSQGNAAVLAYAENLFAGERYAEALPVFLKLQKKDSTNVNLNYKCGVCYLYSRSQHSKAIPFLRKAESASTSTSKVPVDVYRYLGDAYADAFQFKEALDFYSTFCAAPNGPEKSMQQVEDVRGKIQLCKKQMELVGAITCPLSFSSEDEKYFEAISPAPPEQVVGRKQADTTEMNETTVGTSVDGQTVLLYADDRGSGNLYTIRLVGNQWTKPQRLNKPLNKGGWETSESVSADGQTLYFTSDRKGGYGGRDIYKCVKQADGTWSKAVNLGPQINTPFDEEAPFIHPNGKILYFSSNALSPKGTFDIFTSKRNDAGDWSKPVNVGYPATIIQGKSYEQLTAEPWRQENLDPGTKFKEKENFMVTFFDAEKAAPITMLKGKATDIYGNAPAQILITVTDNETGQVSATYHSDRGTGEYLFILPVGKNNNITYEAQGYLFQSENMNVFREGNYYELHPPVHLPPLSEGSSLTLNNIFFEKDKTTLLASSYVELDKLYSLMNKTPGLTVEITNHLYTSDSEKQNKLLANTRALAVVKYLADKGIDRERISTKAYGKPRSSKKPEQMKSRMELKILANNSGNKQ